MMASIKALPRSGELANCSLVLLAAYCISVSFNHKDQGIRAGRRLASYLAPTQV